MHAVARLEKDRSGGGRRCVRPLSEKELHADAFFFLFVCLFARRGFESRYVAARGDSQPVTQLSFVAQRDLILTAH